MNACKVGRRKAAAAVLDVKVPQDPKQKNIQKSPCAKPTLLEDVVVSKLFGGLLSNLVILEVN
jgi:hypothetical protein